MTHSYLEVTYRMGRPLAAYFYLPRFPKDASVWTKRAQSGLLVEFAADGRPIGMEITSPSQLTLSALNHALVGVGLAPVLPEDLSPLVAA